MALTDLTRISTAGIATGSTIDSPILRKDVDFRGDQVGVGSALFDSSERELNFKDNVKLTFGDGGDLQLYHDNVVSRIRDQGTGVLLIESDQIKIGAVSNGNPMLVARQGLGVSMMYNGSTKLETTSTGAIVTGVLTATTFSGKISGDTTGNIYAASGISTVYNLRVSNDLTVEGTTTTIDTNLIGVDRVEVGANSNTTVAVSIAQTGTADIINLFDGTTEVLTVTDGGKVGIGTNDPAALLHLQGTGGNTSGLYFKNGPHDAVRQYFNNGNDNSDFVITYDGTGGAELTLHADGNLGLNEANGDDVLIGASSVQGNARLTIAKSAAGFTTAIALGNSSGDGSKIIATKSLILSADYDNNNNASKSYLGFETDGSEKVRITSDGNVGIGTNNPVGNLEVRDAKANLIVAKDGLTVKANSTLHTTYDLIQLGAGGALASYSTATATADTQFIHNAYRHSGGNWKYRYADTAMRLKMNSPGGAFIFESAASGSADGDITFSEKLRITSAGKVLIGAGVTDYGSLNVDGSASFCDNGTNAGLILATDGTTGAAIHCLTTGSFQNGSYSNMRFNALSHKFTYGNTVRMFIKSDGNIGIGTDNPQTLLHLKSSDPTLRIQRYNQSAYGDITADTAGKITFKSDPGNAANGDGFSFTVNNSEKVGITSDGVLSLTSGSTPLSGTGNSYSINIYRDSGSGYGYLDCITGSTSHTGWYMRAYHNGTYNKVIAHNTSDITWFETGGLERVRITSAGSLQEKTGSNWYNVVTQNDIGHDANEIPLNQMLGGMAYMDPTNYELVYEIPSTAAQQYNQNNNGDSIRMGTMSGGCSHQELAWPDDTSDGVPIDMWQIDFALAFNGITNSGRNDFYMKLLYNGTNDSTTEWNNWHLSRKADNNTTVGWQQINNSTGSVWGRWGAYIDGDKWIIGRIKLFRGGYGSGNQDAIRPGIMWDANATQGGCGATRLFGSAHPTTNSSSQPITAIILDADAESWNSNSQANSQRIDGYIRQRGFRIQ